MSMTTMAAWRSNNDRKENEYEVGEDGGEDHDYIYVQGWSRTQRIVEVEKAFRRGGRLFDLVN